MAPFGVDARCGAEEGDRPSVCDPSGERRDRRGLLRYLGKVAAAEFRPRNGRTVLAVVVGVQLAARSKLRQPSIPCLGILPHAARSVPTHENAIAVLAFGRIVPALGS